MFRKTLILVVLTLILGSVAASEGIEFTPDDLYFTIGFYPHSNLLCTMNGTSGATTVNHCFALPEKFQHLIYRNVVMAAISMAQSLSLESGGAQLMSAQGAQGVFNPSYGITATAPPPDPCADSSHFCPHGIDTYPLAYKCLEAFLKNCPNSRGTIETLTEELKNYKCPDKYVDLTGSKNVELDIFLNRRSSIRLSIEQYELYRSKCILNNEIYTVNSFHLKCQSLRVFACHVEVTRLVKYLDRSELDRTCAERKAEVLDLRSLSVREFLDTSVINGNFSVLCLIVDAQQKIQLEEEIELLSLEIYVNVSARANTNFAAMVTDPVYGSFDENALALFNHKGLIGSGGLIVIGNKTFVATSRHVVASESSLWVCNSKGCACYAVILPTDDKADVAFLIADSKKGHTAGVLQKNSGSSFSINGFAQHGATIDARSFVVSYLGSTVTNGNYKYLLTDHNAGMSTGLSGSIAVSSGIAVGVFGGTWSKSYLWSTDISGMVALFDDALLDFARDYDVARTPTCLGTGSQYFEDYRNAVSSYLADTLEKGAKKLR